MWKNIIFCKSLILSILFVNLITLSVVYADGSRDLYPSNNGGRAYMVSSTGRVQATMEAWPFPMLGEHFVYAKVGEFIAVGSSVMGYSNGGIRLTAPDGAVYTHTGSTTGRIVARVNELAGPRLPGGGGNTYIPYERQVGAGQEGVWKVEFLPVASSTSTTQAANPGRSFADTWNQATAVTIGSTNDNLNIAAWDVSVRNNAGTSSQWIPGRVYVNLLHLYLPQATDGTTLANGYGFSATMYTLTKDGYVYRVNNNGNYGVGFAFFSNNNGFIDKNTNEPLYSSVNISSDILDFVHSPIVADAGGNITNKMFYRVPATDLPATSTSQAVPGGNTWLRIPRIPPAVDSVKIIGYDGTEGQVSNKGGHFRFVTDNLASRYRIVIMPPLDQPSLFTPRTLTGPAQEGVNMIPWDGKDGAGLDLPPGFIPAQVGVSLQTAEIHFPYIDMEINPNGIIIELMKDDLSGVELDGNGNPRDIVYWNDTGIDNAGGGAPQKPVPVNASHTLIPAGTSSNTNGHRWGTYGGTSGTSGNNGQGNYGFGNNKSIDTWTFVDGDQQVFGANIIVKESDVEVISITSSQTGVVNVGDSWNYSVNVINNGTTPIETNTDPLLGPLSGPASFMLYVPDGVSINPAMVGFNSPCGVAIIGTPTFVGGIYIARLDMPVGCPATFTIPVTAISGIQTGNGNVNTWATILRPDDFTDPDATNPFPDVQPQDPFFEADGIQTAVDGPGGLGDALFLNPGSINLSQTNNIKLNSQPYMIADVEIKKTGSRTGDNNGNATFILTVKNNGPSIAHNVTVEDVLSSRYTYSGTHAASQGSVTFSSPTLTWNVGTLGVNGTATLTFTTSNNNNGADRTNTATIQADEFDPNLPNNSSTIGEPAFNGAAVDLRVLKEVNNSTPHVGGEVVFTITLNRVSPPDQVVNDVVVTDLLPQGYVYKSHTVSQGTYIPSTGLWNVGTINNGNSRTLSITAFVKPPTGIPNEYLNVASITAASRSDSDLTNNSDSDLVIPQIVDLSIAKVVVDDELEPDEGQQIAFEVTVSNLGPVNATGVVVYDKLPDGYEFVSASSTVGTYDENTGIWTIGALSNGSNQTLTINVIVKGAGQYVNSAIVSGNLPESSYANNSAHVEVIPTCVIRNVSPKLTNIP